MLNKDTNNLMNGLRDMIRANDSETTCCSQLDDVCMSYVRNHCLHPRKLAVKDSVTNADKVFYVGCGHCFHCRYLRKQEWVTRMILETESRKFCYFITLTYASYGSDKHIPSCLLDAYFRLDKFNENNRLCYSPCLLRLEHVQRFMKYLRKNHDSEIVFFSGSEYGSKYGRPHHHLILWSDTPITRDEVESAWSARIPHLSPIAKKNLLSRNGSISRLIGRVDYNDLNANGTIVADGINFGHDKKKCFSYVAKYVCKQFVDDVDLMKSTSRLRLFIQDLSSFDSDPSSIRPQISFDLIESIFNSRIKNQVSMLQSWAEHFSSYIRNKLLTDKKLPYYVKQNLKREIDDFAYLPFQHDLCTPSQMDSAVFTFYRNLKPFVCRKLFKPFCNASRSYTIGSLYLVNNLERFKNHNYTISAFDGSKLICPRYFIRKTKEYICQFYQQKDINISQKSVQARPVINEDMYRSLLAQFDSLDSHLRSYVSTVPFVDGSCSWDVQRVLRSSYAFIDKVQHCKCILRLCPDGYFVVSSYKYNKHTHMFDYWKSDKISTFIRYLVLNYSQYQNYDDIAKSLQSDLLIEEQFYSDLDFYCNSFFGSSSMSVLIDKHVEFMNSLNHRKDFSDSINQRKYIE